MERTEIPKPRPVGAWLEYYKETWTAEIARLNVSPHLDGNMSRLAILGYQVQIANALKERLGYDDVKSVEMAIAVRLFLRAIEATAKAMEILTPGPRAMAVLQLVEVLFNRVLLLSLSKG